MATYVLNPFLGEINPGTDGGAKLYSKATAGQKPNSPSLKRMQKTFYNTSRRMPVILVGVLLSGVFQLMQQAQNEIFSLNGGT